MSNSVAALPKWRQLLEKSIYTQRMEAQSKFFQVANISVKEATNEYTVENRTLVFRGFAANTNSIFAITDSRSDKYKQWQLLPQSQICWYFTKTREQYRITNSIELLTQDNEDSPLVETSSRSGLWTTLSATAKAQFLSPISNQATSKNIPQDNTNEYEVPTTFVVIVFTPNTVDYLNLNTSPHTRELHCLEEGLMEWSFRSINP